MHLADLARHRQAAYRLFGGVLLYPAEERLRTLSAVARELERAGQELAGFAFFPQWIRFLRALMQCEGTGTAGLEEAYVRLFVVNPDGLCPPYASHYLAAEAPAWVIAEIEREYASSSVSLAPSLGEPPDHVAVELEFLSLLCGEEAQAWDRKALPDAMQRLQVESRFLTSHLCPWVSEFARIVALEDGGGFYSLATEAMWTFVEQDRELLGALLERFPKEREDVA
ncbi:MAG: molecular chaperone [Anaerolineae bacterium]